MRMGIRVAVVLLLVMACGEPGPPGPMGSQGYPGPEGPPGPAGVGGITLASSRASTAWRGAGASQLGATAFFTAELAGVANMPATAKQALVQVDICANTGLGSTPPSYFTLGTPKIAPGVGIGAGVTQVPCNELTGVGPRLFTSSMALVPLDGTQIIDMACGAVNPSSGSTSAQWRVTVLGWAE